MNQISQGAEIKGQVVPIVIHLMMNDCQQVWGKTRITIHLDDDVIDAFRARAEESSHGYQTLINDALREFLASASKPVDSKTLRRILREELHKTS